MRKNTLDGYYDDVDFLELVEEYKDLSERELRYKIAEDVYGWIVEAGDACYMSLGEAQTRINVFKYIIEQREKENA